MSRTEFRIILWLVLLISSSSCERLTFELADNDRECFIQHINASSFVKIQFKVIKGGNFDIDVEIKGPNNEVLNSEEGAKFGEYYFKTAKPGNYEICFDNTISSFTHKVIYFRIKYGPLVDELDITNLTNKDATARYLATIRKRVTKIGIKMDAINDFQIEYRHKEIQSRNKAENLNSTVQIWSIMQSFLILFVGFIQVLLVKTLFLDENTVLYELIPWI